MMKKLFLLFLPLLLTACMKDDELWKKGPQPYGQSPSGVFIINEGNFMFENASLSYYDIKNRQVYNDVFFNANGMPLGDVAISMEIRDSLGYVVLNGSGRIYVIDIRNFELKGKITGFTSPRYLHFVSDKKAYVSDLYARAVSVVDPELQLITAGIDVNNHQPAFYQHPTEQMLQHGRFVFTNCWSFDNKVLVIDSELDRVVDSILVPAQPQSMVADRHGSFWVLSDGGFEGNPFAHERAALLRINADTYEVEESYLMGLDDMPSELGITGGGDTLYFLNRHVFRFVINSSGSPEVFIESPYGNQSSGGFYGLGIDPSNSDIYVADAIDFVQAGIVYRYRPDGMPADTFRVGIIPGSFCFRY
jgi:DNA-binding beta-propeller fold protein YncE